MIKTFLFFQIYTSDLRKLQVAMRLTGQGKQLTQIMSTIIVAPPNLCKQLQEVVIAI